MPSVSSQKCCQACITAGASSRSPGRQVEAPSVIVAHAGAPSQPLFGVVPSGQVMPCGVSTAMP